MLEWPLAHPRLGTTPVAVRAEAEEKARGEPRGGSVGPPDEDILNGGFRFCQWAAARPALARTRPDILNIHRPSAWPFSTSTGH
jgi:hypothetical protein